MPQTRDEEALQGPSSTSSLSRVSERRGAEAGTMGLPGPPSASTLLKAQHSQAAGGHSRSAVAHSPPGDSGPCHYLNQDVPPRLPECCSLCLEAMWVLASGRLSHCTALLLWAQTDHHCPDTEGLHLLGSAGGRALSQPGAVPRLPRHSSWLESSSSDPLHCPELACHPTRPSSRLLTPKALCWLVTQ